MPKTLQIPREEIYELYVERDMTIREVSYEIGCSKSVIERLLVKYEIPSRPQTWRRKPIENLSGLYEEHSVKKIAELLGRSVNYVSLEMKKSGVKAVPGKHYTYVGSGYRTPPDPLHEFFLSDSPELYYVVGFVSADGNISTEGTCVTVSQSEVGILEDIGSLLGRIPTRKHNDGVHTLFLGGRLLAELFIDKWHILPNKSRTIRLFGVPDQYFGDWLRGYFDGNGSVLNKRSKGSFTGARVYITCGSAGLLQDIEDALLRLGLSSAPKICENSLGWGTSYRVSYGKKDSELIYHLMYDDAGIFLKRKKEKFDQLRREHPLVGK